MASLYECIICFKPFTDPVVLNCGHTFDKTCIESCKDCPICRNKITGWIVNWQLLQIMQNQDLSFEQNSSEEDPYLRVTNWSTLYSGVLLRYKLFRNNHVRSGWLISYDSANQIVNIYYKNQKYEIPTICIEEAWYCPDFIKNTDLMEYPTCCTIM